MQETLVQFFKNYPIVAPIIFILLRSVAVIIPPIPGLVFDLVGIAVFGPLVGFIYAETGVVLGAMVAFYIARRFREPMVKRFVSLQKVNKWEQTVSERKKFWALVAIRLPTNTFFDYISYGAGLTTIKAGKFFLSTLIGNMPMMLVIYFLGGLAFQKGFYYIVMFVLAVLIWIFLFGNKFYRFFLRTAGEKREK
ncbi:MAG: VTT domain-containing protein [Candidatus Doudnabacteria bacterium]